MKKLIELLFISYSFLFSRKLFYNFNLFLYYISLHGLGILNYQNVDISGEYNFLNKLLRERMIKTIFDIGAYHGAYIKAINKIRKDVRIYAFEPNPNNYRLLNQLKIRNVYMHNIGFSNKRSKAKLFDYHYSKGSEHSSIYKEVIESIHSSKSKSYTIILDTLDHFTSKNNILVIDLLKIDTEGNEYNILLGAKHLLRYNKIKVIHFEFNEMNVISKVFLKDYIKLLSNYSFFRLLTHDLIPIQKYNPVQHEIFSFQNIIAINNKYLNKLASL